MQKIGMITEDYWKGGLAKFNINLVNNWPDKDTHFTIFTNRENRALKDNIVNPNTDYIYFNFKTVSSDIGAKKGILKKIYRKIFFKYSFFIFRYFTFKRLIKRCSIDYWIISNGGYPGSDLCRLALLILKREKGIFVFHGAVQRPRLLFLLVEIILDKIIFFKNRFNIVTVSHINSKSILKRPWVSNLDINVIYNGVEQPRNILSKKEASDKHIVVMLSGLRPYKGQKVIIQAAERLKSEGFDLKIKFYGCDFDRFTNEIKKMIQDSSCPEVFSMPGFYPVEKIMVEADVVVVPSLTHESFGYTAVEAMAYGIPVIVSDIGGLPEVTGSAGIICKTGDIKEWASAIKDILTNRSLRQMHIEQGIKRSKDNFRIEDMVMKYRKLLIQNGKNRLIHK